jgi:hypothetical protein
MINNYGTKEKIALVAKPQIYFSISQKNIHLQNTSMNSNQSIDAHPIIPLHQDHQNHHAKSRSKKKIYVLTK